VDEGTSEGIDESPQEADPGVSWAEYSTEQARAYIRQVCGPSPGAAVMEQAVREVRRLVGGPSPPSAAALENVVATARAAALTAAERSARGLGQRLRALARRRTGCTKVPALLGKRSAGRLSSTDATTLYHHLDRCHECAGLAGRVGAAEWDLRRAFGWPSGSAETDRDREAPGSAGSDRAPVNADPTAERGAVEAGLPAASARSGPQRPRRWGMRTRSLPIVAVLVVLAAGAIAATQLIGGHGRSVVPAVPGHPLTSNPVIPPPGPTGVPAGLPLGGLVLGSAATQPTGGASTIQPTGSIRPRSGGTRNLRLRSSP
jgi:hypothetical protein